MSTELVKVKRETPLPEMMEMAKLFVESKMFDGITQVASAFVKIKAGAEIGLEPFQSMSGIHIIKGKVSIGAGLMAGCVKGSGKYDYKVVKLDDTICSIDFFKGTKLEGNSTFTIADARKAQTQNLEKFPRNMLFARAMSNGVKWYCPDVFTTPVYTPEEMGSADFIDDVPAEISNAPKGSGQAPDSISDAPQKKNKLTAVKYQQALEGVKTGSNLPNSEVSFYTFLTTQCELTETQLEEIEAANTAKPQ